MHQLNQRTSVLTWLTAIAVAVMFAGAGVRADDKHEPGSLTADNTDGDTGHAHADDRHDEHEAASNGDPDGEAGHGGVDYDDVPLIFDLKLFCWSLGLFLLFVFLSRKYAWAPLIQGLDAREARVNQALHDAEAARIGAEKLLAEHAARMEQVQDEVKEIVAAARQKAEDEKTRIIAEADAEASALRNQAIGDIETARRQAVDDLNSQIDHQVTIATEHVLGHRG